MRDPFFTIIISAYDLEDLIADSVRSVTAQSFSSLECIVVDDGSADGTAAVVRRLAAEDPRVRLIPSGHAGVSHARNLALAEAKGRYVLFLDGDDTLDGDCLKVCAEELMKDDAPELLVFGIRYIDYEGGKVSSVSESVPPLFDFKNGSEYADRYIVYHALLLYSTGNKFYDLKRLRSCGISFREGLIFGEDRIFNYDYLRVCGRIVSVKRCFYNYRHIRPDSLSSSFRRHHIEELMMLHREKISCMLSLSRDTTENEKQDFVLYDLTKETRNALQHIINNAGSLSDEEVLDEFSCWLDNAADFAEKWAQTPGKDALAAIDEVNREVFEPEHIPELSGIENVVILGSTACDYRVRRAIELFRGLDPLYICSGGNLSIYADEDGSLLTEAEYMKKVLEDSGVSPERIKTDGLAASTWQNIANSAEQIKKGRTCLITGGFHTRRARMMLKEQGLSACVLPAYGPNTHPGSWYAHPKGIPVILEELSKKDSKKAAEAALILMKDMAAAL